MHNGRNFQETSNENRKRVKFLRENQKKIIEMFMFSFKIPI